MSHPRLPGLKVAELDSVTSPFDLTLLLEASGEVLKGLVEYNTDLFDQATIDRLIGHFGTLLAGIVQDPDRRPSELPLLAQAEQRQLAEWNATSALYAHEQCMPSSGTTTPSSGPR
jgi:non-ribosomal peptide synthetase component F